MTSRIQRLLQTAASAPEGDWAEFGVFTGSSAKELIKILPGSSTLHLFDSFQGLPVDGPNKYWEKGKFATAPFKPPHDRVKVVAGWFEDTVPGYFEPNTVSFVHMDCDLYESTRDVLMSISEALKPGALIQFDEMFAWPSWKDGEYKALMEWDGRSFEWVHRDKRCQQAVVKVV